MNYYSFADNRPSLKTIFFIFRESLIRTIQRKCNLTKKAFFAKFGSDISISLIRKDHKVVIMNFICPDMSRNPTNFKGTTVYKDPLRAKN